MRYPLWCPIWCHPYGFDVTEGYPGFLSFSVCYVAYHRSLAFASFKVISLYPLKGWTHYIAVFDSYKISCKYVQENLYFINIILCRISHQRFCSRSMTAPQILSQARTKRRKTQARAAPNARSRVQSATRLTSDGIISSYTASRIWQRQAFAKSVEKVIPVLFSLSTQSLVWNNCSRVGCNKTYKRRHHLQLHAHKTKKSVWKR